MKKSLLLILIILTIAVIGVGAYYYLVKNKSSADTGSPCPESSGYAQTAANDSNNAKDALLGRYSIDEQLGDLVNAKYNEPGFVENKADLDEAINIVANGECFAGDTEREKCKIVSDFVSSVFTSVVDTKKVGIQNLTNSAPNLQPGIQDDIQSTGGGYFPNDGKPKRYRRFEGSFKFQDKLNINFSSDMYGLIYTYVKKNCRIGICQKPAYGEWNSSIKVDYSLKITDFYSLKTKQFVTPPQPFKYSYPQIISSASGSYAPGPVNDTTSSMCTYHDEAPYYESL